ncbi:MAG: hypothetical protein JWQ30_1611, partial [Sediminibacterium sp.]|nr:hypothetical protein [Sediminibacterium sp.]
KGIEKIQLIENYNDKTYLANRMQKGSELVVNLKFDRKYLYRIIASNEAGLSISPATDFYKIRQNIVSLIPRIKFITTTNFNNTGLLATEILGTAFAIPELAMLRKDGISFDLLPRLSAGAVEQLPDISSQIVPKNKMTANHSSVITNNGMYRASKKWLFKSIFQYYRDAFEQKQLQTQDYSVSGTNLIVTNTQVLHKEMPVMNASFESIFSPSAATQLVYKANLNTLNEKDSLDEFKQSLNTYTVYKNRSTRFHQQLGFSFGVDSNRIIDIRAMHITEHSRQLPFIYPANIYKAFTQDSLLGFIASSIQTDHTGYELQAKITTRRKKSSWSFELLHTIDNLQLNSAVTLLKKDTVKELTGNSLRNDAALMTYISDIIFSYNAAISRKIYLRTSNRFETGRLLFNNHTSYEQGRSYNYYLPSYSLSFSLARNKNIGLNIDYKSKLPGIYDLSSGYVFATGSSIIRGDSTLQFGVSKTLSLSYSYAELVKKKLMWNLICFYSSEPVLYLAERNPEVFYSTTNKFISNKDVTIFGLTSTASRYVSAIKSQLGFDMQVNSFRTFYSTKNQSGPIVLSSFSPTIKCKTLVTGNFTAGVSVKASFFSQVFNKNQPGERKNTSQAFTYTAELVYRAGASFTFNTHYQYIEQRQAQKKYSLHSAEMAVKYIAVKDKLHFLLSANNIFTGNYFNSASFSQYSINTQSIDMIRPYLMLHATWEF